VVYKSTVSKCTKVRSMRCTKVRCE